MKPNPSSLKLLKHKVGNMMRVLSINAVTLTLVACLLMGAFCAHADVSTGDIPTGDIYVYTSPTTYVDVTADFHEDPIILLNGVEVQVCPDYTAGIVYDANGDMIGFIAPPA